MLYHTHPNLFSGEGPFFFSSLMAGPTYQPSVWHSNPNTPLIPAVTAITAAHQGHVCCHPAISIVANNELNNSFSFCPFFGSE